MLLFLLFDEESQRTYMIGCSVCCSDGNRRDIHRLGVNARCSIDESNFTLSKPVGYGAITKNENN